MPRRIEALDWGRRLLDALPGDPRSDNVPRQVRGACWSRVEPTPVSAPELLVVVPEVAALLDLDPSETPALLAALSGNGTVPGMAPYAACYGGHQFGSWAGQLGDGRAITLGEVRPAQAGAPSAGPWELQLKGAGPTPYSRRGDGRAVLRSSLRELVCSEAMFHLGVPTTRALSLVRTGDGIVRDILYDGHPQVEPGAIVCRVAPSFLRFGNFEIFASRGEVEVLRKLVEYTLRTFYPVYVDGDRLDVPGFVAEVARRTARMIVGWMRVGFVHGVMNTDNMSILGLTIDYGPYGWIEPFDPDWTPNTTDAPTRRYRFANQPRVALWNLIQLAQALTPLVEDTAALEQALEAYADELGPAQLAMSLEKLGLTGDTDRAEEDSGLVTTLLARMSETPLDMTLFYRCLSRVDLAADGAARRAALAEAYYGEPDAAHGEAMQRWLDAYARRAAVEGLSLPERRQRMDAVNPLYVPRNWVVHETIGKVAAGDVGALPALLDVLRQPYTERPGLEAFAAKRPDWATNVPGCSMLSCSS